MAKQSPTLYSVAKTFMWFALVSLLLTACLGGIVWTDYDRPWKKYQKKFNELRLKKTQEELKAAEQGIDKNELARLEEELKKAKTETSSHKEAAAKLLKEIDQLDTQIAKSKASYQDLKQFLDSDLYYLEEYRLHQDHRAKSYQEKVRALRPKVDQAKAVYDAFQKTRDQKAAQIEAFSAKQKEAGKAVGKLLADIDRLKTKAEKIKPSIVKDVLNAPMVDFVAPTLKVQQIVLEGLHDDYHFAKVQKVDRCTTCHLGIDQKGFEDAPQPFRTHPKLELYLGSTSAHPIEKIGCTVCHSGSGHSVDFVNSAHTPKNKKQAEDWAKKYSWHELPTWEHKMLPSGTVEASCAKCHRDVLEVPQADQLNRGRKLAQSMGCFNCHTIKGFAVAAGGGNLWKVGPDLTHIKSKVNAQWIAKWLEDPTHFRPSTKMPKVFNLSNTSSEEDRQKNAAAIESITAYLIKNSESEDLLPIPLKGDSANGEKLVKTLGCLACHNASGTGNSDHGPELSSLGSKTTPEWIYSWIKDPKRMSPGTRMPNLRLSDQEASDITAYLVNQNNPDFDKKITPKANPQVVDSMILTHLQSTQTQQEAKEALQAMSEDDKLLYLGKKSIAHQGCYTCHTIKGFEDGKPIGAELSNEGQKNIHQFDFGFVNIPHTRHDFIKQKLKDPRIFDQGKERSYYDKLRMPQFNFSDEQVDALTTFILSLSEEEIPLEMQKLLTSEEIETEKGRLLVSKLNCTGCHTLDGHAGSIREITEDAGQMPPVLDGEGAKVQEKWLREFLKTPTPIRPWLQYRMPTFNFSEEELTTLNKYFNHLAHEEISYAGLQLPPTTSEALNAGQQLFESFQCVKCHQISQESAAMGSSFLAPDLKMSKNRLKPSWVYTWLEDPQQLQADTMMPTFFSEGQSPMPEVLGGDVKKQIEAIRDYLYQYEGSEAPDSKK